MHMHCARVHTTATKSLSPSKLHWRLMVSHVYMHMQVELAGGNQRHPDTQQFHTGISYIRATGTPVYNVDLVTVNLADACHDQASMCADDPDDTSCVITCASDTCTHVSSSTAVATTSAMANQPQPVVLIYVEHDSLVWTGGLRATSERGRLLEEDFPEDLDWDAMIELSPSEDF